MRCEIKKLSTEIGPIPLIFLEEISSVTSRFFQNAARIVHKARQGATTTPSLARES